MSKNPFVVLAEKVATTYVEAFLTILLGGDWLNVSTAEAAAIAALPAALTVIANGTPLVPIGLPFYVDLGLRAVRTYAVTFVGFAAAVPVFALDYSIAVSASAAGMTAALALVKGALASKIGRSDSAAVLPASLDPAA